MVLEHNSYLFRSQKSFDKDDNKFHNSFQHLNMAVMSKPSSDTGGAVCDRLDRPSNQEPQRHVNDARSSAMSITPRQVITKEDRDYISLLYRETLSVHDEYREDMLEYMRILEVRLSEFVPEFPFKLDFANKTVY